VKQKPDADGLYWFRGTFGGDPYATIVEVYDKDCISILGDDCPCMVQDFDGEWHGPLVAPWDASATGVFITRLFGPEAPAFRRGEEGPPPNLS